MDPARIGLKEVREATHRPLPLDLSEPRALGHFPWECLPEDMQRYFIENHLSGEDRNTFSQVSKQIRQYVEDSTRKLALTHPLGLAAAVGKYPLLQELQLKGTDPDAPLVLDAAACQALADAIASRPGLTKLSLVNVDIDPASLHRLTNGLTAGGTRSPSLKFEGASSVRVQALEPPRDPARSYELVLSAVDRGGADAAAAYLRGRPAALNRVHVNQRGCDVRLGVSAAMSELLAAAAQRTRHTVKYTSAAGEGRLDWEDSAVQGLGRGLLDRTGPNLREFDLTDWEGHPMALRNLMSFLNLRQPPRLDVIAVSQDARPLLVSMLPVQGQGVPVEARPNAR